MAKLTTVDLSSLSNQTSAVALLNSNFAAIETALENTLSRDGTSPNAMEANLDMNSGRILNLPAPLADEEPARKIDLENFATAAGLGDALTINPLSQFASTTSAQLKGVISDGTGSGALVFAGTPTFISPILGDATATTINNTVIPTSQTLLKTVDIGSTVQGYSSVLSNLVTSNLLPANATFAKATGGEGGELHLQLPSSGSSLAGDVVIDLFNNSVRVYEGSGTVRGATLDLTTCSAGTASTFLISNNIGSTVQAYDADLASWAGVTRAAGFDTFTATPTSANLAALVTDETGSGSLVLGTAPSFTTSIKPVSNDGASIGISGTAFSDLFLASGGVINFNAGNVTLTHLAGELSLSASTNFYTGSDANPAVNNVAGWGLTGAGKLGASVSSGQAADFNRKTDDGTIVNFRQDGTIEGAISVSGTTLTYATFTGSHWSQLESGKPFDILPGTVIESVDTMCTWETEETNEHLPRFKVSDTAGTNRVYGVFFGWDGSDQLDDALIASLGTYVVRLAKGSDIQGGDLVESNGDGCARKQADDLIRASTIGKVTAGVVVKTYEDGSYLVPCVLYCG